MIIRAESTSRTTYPVIHASMTDEVSASVQPDDQRVYPSGIGASQSMEHPSQRHIPEDAHPLAPSDRRELISELLKLGDGIFAKLAKSIKKGTDKRPLSTRRQSQMFVDIKAGVIERLTSLTLERGLDWPDLFEEQFTYTPAKLRSRANFYRKCMYACEKWSDLFMTTYLGIEVVHETFKFSREDYFQAGYDYKRYWYERMPILGGFCHDFAFTQMREWVAYPYVFDKSNAVYPQSSQPGADFATWGYRVVDEPMDADLIVYSQSEDQNSKMVHFGLFSNGQVVSKWGRGPRIYKHDIGAVCSEYGDSFTLLKKSYCPRVDRKLIEVVHDYHEFPPLTDTDLRVVFSQKIDEYFERRAQKRLPCASVWPVGDHFLHQYRRHCEQAIEDIPDELAVASGLKAMPQAQLDGLCDAIGRMRL